MAVIGWWAEAFIIPSGMATTGGFGTPQVGVLSGEPQTITLTGISSGETFGVCTVTVGAIIVSPAGIVSGEEFGAPGVTGPLPGSSVNTVPRNWAVEREYCAPMASGAATASERTPTSTPPATRCVADGCGGRSARWLAAMTTD